MATDEAMSSAAATPTGSPAALAETSVSSANSPNLPAETAIPSPPTEVSIADIEGQSLVNEHCVQCHILTKVEEHGMSEEEWATTVQRMMGKGANLTADEQSAVVKFLAETYPPVPALSEKSLSYAEVLYVTAVQQSDTSWTFEVKVQHEDTGWDHYANSWEVLTLDGEVIATHVLTHPHVEEQPFTRSMSGIAIPNGTSSVRVPRTIFEMATGAVK